MTAWSNMSMMLLIEIFNEPNHWSPNMTQVQQDEAKLRERITDLSLSLKALSHRKLNLEKELQQISAEYLPMFYEKEKLERQLTKVKLFATRKEPQTRTKKLSTTEKLLRNLTPENVVEMLARMKKGGKP